MNEEELFCKLFPEYVVNGKPLSPYFDLFESGYEQAENRVAELEEKLEQTEKDLADYQFNYPTIKELQKENAELKKEWQEQVQRATDEGYARTLQTMQLTTAIEIIKDLLSLCEGETDSKLVFTRAEIFLKEIEE